MEAMTQEQRQKTKEALSRYGQKNWVYGPCNWGWKRAIQLAEEYYREADPGLRGSILQLRYMERRRQIAGIRLEAFSGFRIELARCMPDIGILLGRFESFSFHSVQMQYFRSLHIFDVPQDTGYVFHIVSIDRAEVADVHPFKDILLLGGH